MARGVDPARIRVAGYGDRCPESDDEGERYKDRRVDLKVVRSGGKDTGVEIGCEAARDARD